MAVRDAAVILSRPATTLWSHDVARDLGLST